MRRRHPVRCGAEQALYLKNVLQSVPAHVASRIEDLLPQLATDEAASPGKLASGHQNVALAEVAKYDYPLTFYATSAMSIRMRANML